MASETIDLVIRKRDGVLYEGSARAFSSLNEIGKFDILSMHSNFVTTIQEKITIHLTGGSEKEINIENGVLRVKENKIEVYLGI